MQRTGATSLRPRPSLDPAGAGGRLAELVAHLTGCAPETAVDAVEHALPADADRDDLSLDDRLGVVARAMVAVRGDHGVDLREAATDRRPA